MWRLRKNIMKNLFLLVVVLFAVNSFGQKCHYSIDKIDDFTKKRVVRTEMKMLFENKIGAYANSVLFGNDKTEFTFSVAADYTGGFQTLLFILNEENNAITTEDYTQIDFLFATDYVISLTKQAGEGSKTEKTWTYWRFYVLTQEQWDYFKTNPIKKIRMHYADNLNGDIVIKDKYSNSISTVINCLDALNLPKEKKTNNPEIADNHGFTPSNDTASISIYKQWVRTYTFKNGMPKSSNENSFFILKKDNTYIESNLKKGERIQTKGTFKVISNNKFLELTEENGEPFTLKILRLTKTEMEIKAANGYQCIYGVY